MSMQAQLDSLRDDYTQKYALAENIRMKYDGDKIKTMTGDELANFNKAIDDAEETNVRIKALEKQIKLHEDSKSNPNGDPLPISKQVIDEDGILNKEDTKLRSAVFNKFLQYGERAQLTKVEREYFERDGQTLGDPTAGGYLAAPQTFVNQLILDINNEVYVKGISTVIPCQDATSLGIPSLDTDVSDADWTGEITASSASTISLGKRELKPHYLSKLVKISTPLIRKAVMSPEDLVRSRLAYKFGVTQEKAFMTGNGVNQPLGVMTPSADGISTARDVTSAVAITIGAADLFKMYFSLKTGYASNATWIWSRDSINDIRQLKDTAGHFIWQPFDFPGKQLTGGNPGTIIGRPYIISEYQLFKTSGAWVSGDYTGILGQFSYYMIAESLSMTIQTLMELYAVTNQLGYLARMELDAMPALENAFVRLKMQ